MKLIVQNLGKNNKGKQRISNSISIERTSNMNEKLLSKEFNKNKFLTEKYIAIFLMSIIGMMIAYMELFAISVIRFQKLDYYYFATTINGILVKSNVIGFY